MILSSAVKKYPKYYYKHPLSRPTRKHAPIETQRVYPVLTAEQLLKQRGRRKVMDEIRVTCGAPIEYFNALYKQLIENCAEFLQHLPVANNFNLCRLDKQLHLASLALSLREPYLLAGSLLNRTTDQEKALWNYVIFSGLLLGRMGQLVTQYNVSLCDEKGVFIKQWEPFSGPMKEQGSYYKIRSIDPHKTTVDSQLNVMIARQLMPPEGYNWIASVPAALEQWILALDDSGERGAGTLSARFFVQLESWLNEHQKLIEQEFDLEALFEKYLEELLDEQLLEEEHRDEFEEEYVIEPEETLVGEHFYQWMRKGIQEKRLPINTSDAAIFMTKQGALLLHPEIFEKFIAENPTVSNNVNQVFDQFSKIGLIANNKLENYVAKFPGLRESNVKGVLLKDVATLFGKNEPPPLTPYILKANFMKRASEKTITEKILTTSHQSEAKHKAHEADLNAKEKQQELPNLGKQEKTTYKEFSSTNKPPMKR